MSVCLQRKKTFACKFVLKCCVCSGCWDSARQHVSVQVMHWKVNILPTWRTAAKRRTTRTCLRHRRRRWHRQKQIKTATNLIVMKSRQHLLYECILNKKLSYRWQTARRVEILTFENHRDLETGDFLLMFNSNYGSISRRFWDGQCQKMSWPWNLGQRSLKVIESGTSWSIVYDFLLVFYSNFVPKAYSFWDIPHQRCCDLENQVRGPSRSLEMSPFDIAHTTPYWRSIITMALSRVVSEIFNVKKCRDLEIWVRGHSRSSKVVSVDRLFIVSY